MKKKTLQKKNNQNQYQTFDIETTSLNPYNKNSKIFSYCKGDYYGNVGVYRTYDLKGIQQLFDDTTIEKIAHNYIFELAYLRQNNIIIPENTIWHDTKIMSNLINNLSPSHRLHDLCDELCGYKINTNLGILTSRQIDAKVKAQADARGKRYDRVDKDIFYYYQIADGQRPMILFRIYYPVIKADPKLYKIYKTEIQFIRVCEKMQEFGLCLHIENTVKLQNSLQIKLTNLLQESFDLFGEFLNLNSPVHVKRLLFKMLRLPVLKYNQKGAIVADKDVLLNLREQFPKEKEKINLVLKQRSYTSGIANTKNYRKLADENNNIHSNINSYGTKTGRPSCSKPNLLNVAKEDVKKNPFPIPARSCFKAPNKSVLYFIDYKGLQMRLIANACQEKEMLDIINKDGDVHHLPTELFYSGYEKLEIKKDLLTEKKWKMYRGSGKNCHFAVPFGTSEQGAAKVLNISLPEAIYGLQQYKKRFPKIYNYSRSQIDQVKEFGYIVTPAGKKIHVLQSKPYMGANYYIQGAEADLMKYAIVKVNEYFERVWGDRIRLVLDIYDELIFSCPLSISKQYENEVLKQVSKLMVTIPFIDVRLDVEIKKSYTVWNEAKEIKLVKTLQKKKERKKIKC